MLSEQLRRVGVSREPISDYPFNKKWVQAPNLGLEVLAAQESAQERAQRRAIEREREWNRQVKLDEHEERQGASVRATSPDPDAARERAANSQEAERGTASASKRVPASCPVDSSPSSRSSIQTVASSESPGLHMMTLPTKKRGQGYANEGVCDGGSESLSRGRAMTGQSTPTDVQPQSRRGRAFSFQAGDDNDVSALRNLAHHGPPPMWPLGVQEDGVQPPLAATRSQANREGSITAGFSHVDQNPFKGSPRRQ